MRIINETKGTTLASQVRIAGTFFSRIIGLLIREALNSEEALIIKPCNSIHTFFMRFAIDAVFLDKQNKVIAIKENMPPFRLSQLYLSAYEVIELPAGKISRTRTCLNDQIAIEA